MIVGRYLMMPAAEYSVASLTLSLILVLKLTLLPSLILGITLAGRRWGPAVAGWLSAFPVISAPILFFIAHEHGATFAAAAAAATLSAVLANLGYGLTYAWSARSFQRPSAIRLYRQIKGAFPCSAPQ